MEKKNKVNGIYSRTLKKIVAVTQVAATCVFLGACGDTNSQSAGDAPQSEYIEDSVVSASNEAIADNAENFNEKSDTVISNEISFIDALGREITVQNPERVVTLLGSFCDTWYLSGGEVIGTVKDSWTAFDIPLSEDVINLGSFLSPDIEAIVAALPDFVIASANTDAQVELAETLEAAGIVVAYFDVSNFDSYLEMLDLCTDITGRKELFDMNGIAIGEQIEAAKAKVDGSNPTVLFIRAAASSVKAKGSDGTVGGEILADLGCINIADSDKSLLDDLSLEAIVLSDPDYIFVTTQGEDTEGALANFDGLIASSSAWSSLSAVKNGNYYLIDKALYNSKPNARWGEAYEYLAQILYQDN